VTMLNMTPQERIDKLDAKEILRRWNAAVAVHKARCRALADSSIDTNEYCAISEASVIANIDAVTALGGYARFTCPDGVALGGDR